ncbi:hypothetical protein MTO96_049781 [Rhipicephalus appendiculatus]
MSSETADHNVRSVKDTDGENDAGNVHLVQRRRSSGQNRGNGYDTGAPRHSCWRCGSNHSEHECQHVGKVCRNCGTRGHLARMCQRRRSGRQGSYALRELSEEEDSKEEMLFALSAQNNVAKARTRPMERNFVWGGRTLRMLIDTGSSVSVIPKNVFRKNRKWKHHFGLSCFLGPLPVVGRVAMNVEHDKTRVDRSLVVVDCDGPLLCGRNTIQAFREAGVSLLEERALPSVYALQAEDGLQGLLEEFSDLFEDRLGCCKAEGMAGVKHTGKDCIGERLQFSGNSAGGDALEASAMPNSSPATPQSPVSTQETWAPEAVPTPSFNANKKPSGTTGLLKREEVQRRV